MNHISDRPAEMIASLLRNNSGLLELYLHYNQITSYGGVIIFKGLQKNQNLRVLDLSFNKLGFIEKNECSLLIAK